MSIPPPLPRHLTTEDWESLAVSLGQFYTATTPEELQDMGGISSVVYSPLLSLYSSKFDDKNKLKQKFIDSISYNTTLTQTTSVGKAISDTSKPLILPVDLELDIDGIGGILPSNSFHSTYLPQRYQDETLFQVFDVNHTVDSSGWNVSIKGKMRSTANRVTKTTTEIKDRFKTIKEQFAKAKLAEDTKKRRELRSVDEYEIKYIDNEKKLVKRAGENNGN